MKTKIKPSGRGKTNLDELLQNIEAKQDDLLSDRDIKISENWGTEYEYDITPEKLRIDIFLSHYGFSLKPLPPLEDLFNLLRAIKKITETLKKEKAPQEIKRIFEIVLTVGFTLSLYSLAGWTRGFTDEKMSYREEFFKRRDEFSKENIFRKVFVETYINEEVFNRFYLEKNEDELYTPKGAQKWDGHYNELCKEYGEEEYIRDYTSPEEHYKDLTEKDLLIDKDYLCFTRDMLHKTELLKNPGYKLLREALKL